MVCYCIDKSDAKCFGRMQLFGCHKHLQRPALANQTRQALCSTPPRDQAQGCPAMSKHGMWRSYAVTACEREV